LVAVIVLLTSVAVSQFGQLLELLLRRPWQRDLVNLVSTLIDDQAVIGHSDEATTDPQETTDLKYREQWVPLVLADDEVVDLADTLVLVVDDRVTAQFAYAIAVLNELYVDFDELNALRQSRIRNSRYSQDPKYYTEYRQAIPSPEELPASLFEHDRRGRRGDFNGANLRIGAGLEKGIDPKLHRDLQRACERCLTFVCLPARKKRRWKLFHER
jgi:hypothetical protein